MRGRFESAPFDVKALKLDEALKEHFEILEDIMERSLESPRARELALTHLEESFMWARKALRDDSIRRSNVKVDTEQDCLNGEYAPKIASGLSKDEEHA